jgi:hypothetical protein
MKTVEQIENEKRMFGMSVEDINSLVTNTLVHSRSTKMLIMSMLSDIQEELPVESSIEINQRLNLIKYLVDTTLDGKEVK